MAPRQRPGERLLYLNMIVDRWKQGTNSSETMGNFVGIDRQIRLAPNTIKNQVIGSLSRVYSLFGISL